MKINVIQRSLPKMSKFLKEKKDCNDEAYTHTHTQKTSAPFNI